MVIREKTVLAAVLACCLWVVAGAMPAQAAGGDLLLAQQGPQGGMQQRQGMPPQQQGLPQGQQQGMPQGQGGANNSCTQSYQRCVMMCAGVGTCVNNCNIGYAVCNQQGGRGGGS
jgi:hypothetical protein